VSNLSNRPETAGQKTTRTLSGFFRRRAMMMPGIVFLFSMVSTLTYVFVEIEEQFEEKTRQFYRDAQHISLPTNNWMAEIENSVLELAWLVDKKDMLVSNIRETIERHAQANPLLHFALVTDEKGKVLNTLSHAKDLPDISTTNLSKVMQTSSSGISQPFNHNGEQYVAVFRRVYLPGLNKDGLMKGFAVVGLAPLTILKNRWQTYEFGTGTGVHIFVDGQGKWLSLGDSPPDADFELAFQKLHRDTSQISGASASDIENYVVSWRNLRRFSSVVVLTQRHQSVYADWRHKNLLVVLVALVATFLVTGVVYLIARSIVVIGKEQETAVRALEESEQRFRDFAENSSDWMWEMDADFRFSFFSEEYLYSGTVLSSSLIGRSREELLNEDNPDHGIIEAHLQDLREQKPFRNFSYNLTTSNGDFIRMVTSGVPSYDRDGNFSGYRGTASDHTQEYLVERKVTELHEQLMLAINALTVGFIVYSPDGKLLICNDKLKELFRGSADLHIPGARYEDLYAADFATGNAAKLSQNMDAWSDIRAELNVGELRSTEIKMDDGRWILYADRLTESGHVVGIREDITDRKKEFDFLKENFEHFRSLIEDGMDMITVVDEFGVSIYENPSVIRFLGENVIGQPTIFRIAEVDRDKVRKSFQKILSDPSSSEVFDAKMIAKDGAVKDIEYRMNNLTHNPAVKGVVIVARDITRQKSSEAVALSLQTRLATILDSAPMMIWSVDEFGKFTLAEGSILSSLGTDAASLVGQSAYDFFGESPSAIFGIREALKSQPSTSSMSIKGITFDTWYMPQSNEEDRITEVIGVSIDVTSRQLAEVALRQIAEGTSGNAEKDFFSTMMASIAEVTVAHHAFIGEITSDGRSIRTLARHLDDDFTNNISYDLAGTPCELVVGQNMQIFDTGLAERFPADEALAKMGLDSYIGMPIMTSKGRPLGLIAVMYKQPLEDTQTAEALLPIYASRAGAEMERLNAHEAMLHAVEEAEFASRAKSEFLANMSHELRTPLNAIIGFSDMLRAGYLGNLKDKQKSYVFDIKESGEHLLNLVNDILDLSKIEAGKQQLSESYFDLQTTIAASVRTIAEIAHAGGLEVQTNIPSHLPNMYADERMLRQILINLLSNAVKFTDVGGRVDLDVINDPDLGLSISVTDHSTRLFS
jgi:PAS domain S-box-containing protein